MVELYAANICFMIAYGTYFLLPVHLRDLGAGNAVIGAVTAAPGITNTAALAWLLISGYKKDPKNLMLWGLLTFGAGCVGMVFLEDFHAVALMRMLHGAGFCLFFIAANTWVSFNVKPESLAKHIGYLGIATLLGQSGAPALAEFASAAWGFRVVFGATALLAAASFLFIHRLPDTPVDGNQQPELKKKASSLGPAVAFLGTTSLLGGGLFGAVMTFSPLHLLESGVTPVSLFFVVYAISAVLVRVIFRSFADTKGHLATARICFVLLALSSFGMSLATTRATFAVAASLFGMGHGLMYPALAAYSVSAVEGGRIRGMAVWAGGFAIGVSLGSWSAGIVAELYPISVVFSSATILPLLASAVLFLRKNKRAAAA